MTAQRRRDGRPSGGEPARSKGRGGTGRFPRSEGTPAQEQGVTGREAPA